MGFSTYKQAFAGFTQVGYFGGTAFDIGEMRHFTDEVVLFLYSHKKDKATVISSRAATGRFAAGEPLDLSLISEETPCFESPALPSAEFSIGALMLPLDGTARIEYADAHELALLFDPSLSQSLFAATEREAVYGVKNAAAFFGCGFHYEGGESAGTAFDGADKSLGAVFLILYAMLRRLSKKRGFNFRLESASGMPAFAVSADLHLERGEELEDAFEFVCLKKILDGRGLPLLYRFATNDGSPRLILRFSPSRVSVETLLRASLPEGVTDYSELSDEERIPDVAGEY